MGAESFLTLQIADFAEGVGDRVAALLQSGAGITLTYDDEAGTLTIANTGLGGSTGSTDNRILRADGTGGATVQNSAVTIDDSGNISGLGSITCTGTIQGTGSATLTLVTQGIRSSRGFEAAASDLFYWTSRSVLTSPSDGVIQFRNFNGTDFNRLQLGGATSSFPAIKRNGAAIEARLADDSGAAAIICGAITASGVVEVPAGTAAAPGLKVGSASQTGLFQSTNSLNFVVNGATRAWVDSNSVMQMNFAQLNGVGSYINFHGGAFLYSGLSNTLEQYNGGSLTSAQTYRLYNTRPSSTNFETLQSQWASNEARIGTAVGSSGGTQRNTVLGAWNSSNTWTAALTIAATGNLTASALFFAGVYTVATLPSAAANAGALAQVTDSSVTTNGSAVSGGGANRVVVFSNGSTWDVVVA